MPLGESELQRIGDYVRGNLSAWLHDVVPQVIIGPELVQGNVRVQEELKSLRQTMETRFEAQQALMETRFAAVDRRFEAVDKRFEDMSERFEDVNKRFEDINKRFDDINKRFAHLQWLGLIGFAGLGILISILS